MVRKHFPVSDPTVQDPGRCPGVSTQNKTSTITSPVATQHTASRKQGSSDIFEGNHFEFLSTKNMSKKLQHGFVGYINNVLR